MNGTKIIPFRKKEGNAQVMKKSNNRVRTANIENITEIIDTMIDHKEINNDLENIGLILIKDSIIFDVRIISTGTRTRADLNISEAIRSAIVASATAIIIFHNHPRDTAEPSKQDYLFTKKVKNAAEAVGITFLDHYIRGVDRIISMDQEGYLDIEQ